MRPWTGADVGVAAVLSLVVVVEAVLGWTATPEDWLPVLLAPLATLPVAVRRSLPIVAASITLVVLAAQAALGSDLHGGFAEPIALVLAVYSVGSRLAIRASVAGLAVGLAGERGELLAERRADDERARIARELHDVVAHHVSAIVIQAGARRRDLADTDPSRAVLSTIEDEGRHTLQELRRLLGLLQRSADASPPLTPQPGLADLPRLVEGMRDQGVAVSLTASGIEQPVGPGLELAIFRLVQESLTNVRKHARTPQATVDLRWRDDGVEVEVLSGPGAGRRRVPGSGFGLRSMRERVQAYGGQVTARRTADGFRVHALLPLDGTR